MITRGLVLATLAVALCACASPEPQRASLQNAVYMVGDNAPLTKASAAPGSTESESEFSVIKRVYWFFAGR
jgi:hypothetical protein